MKQFQNSMDYYPLSASHLGYLQWSWNLKSIITISVLYTTTNESCGMGFHIKSKVEWACSIEELSAFPGNIWQGTARRGSGTHSEEKAKYSEDMLFKSPRQAPDSPIPKRWSIKEKKRARARSKRTLTNIVKLMALANLPPQRPTSSYLFLLSTHRH